MRTKNWMRHLSWGVLGLVAQHGFSQATQDDNLGGVGSFLGWNAGANQILEVKNEANKRIEFYTNAARRMMLSPTLTNQTVNGFSGLDLSGFLGIGTFNPNVQNAPHEPYALLHLDDSGNTPGGYRPWMRAGTLVTQGSDMAFFGMKPGYAGRTHTVVAWCDNSPSDFGGGDLLKFIFSSHTGSGTGVAGTIDGLEAARFSPDYGGNQTFFGVGDWFTAGLNPRERLDVLDGRVRIRQLPDDPQHTGPYKVMVVDNSAAPSNERGVVKWVDPDDLPGGTVACDWVVQPSNSVSTAYWNGNSCPRFPDGVGIGVQEPKAKLHVYYDHSEGDYIQGNATVLGEHRHNELVGVAIHGSAQPWVGFNSHYAGVAESQINNPSLGTSRTYTGVLGTAGGGLYSVGVEGHAANGVEGSAKDLLGVVGRSLAQQSSTRCVGVYGYAKGAANSNDWAGWFDGKTFCPGGVWSGSDEQLKTNIQPLVGATDLINALRPKTYEYRVDEFSRMGFDPGVHAGLLAAELEEVLPAAVKDVVRPAEYDNDGELLAAEVAFKVVNYQELIPVLIAAMKEQNNRIDHLEQALAACCANPNGGRMQVQGLSQPYELDGTLHGSEKLRIQPNPFNEGTTVFYTLDRGGRTQLLANSSDGRDLRVLQEAHLEVGSYQYQWNTASLAPGMYYVTLLLDGQPVVKKAVKVDR